MSDRFVKKKLKEEMKTKERVETLLRAKPHLRDSDNKLIATIWYNDVQIEGRTALDLLNDLADGKLTNSEAIRRARQQVQEFNKGLRGEKYKSRQKHQRKVKKELGYPGR